MNLTPFVFWAFLALVGFLFADNQGALVGLAVGLGISLLVTLAGKR